MEPKRKLKKRYIFLFLFFILVAWTIWGNVSVGTTYYSISSPRLPEAFDGYKIVVVSDLHNAQFGSDNSQITNIIEKEQPDMIAITGDLIDSNKTDIDIAVSLLRRLVQIAPCYYVTGNHEAWIGSQYSELEEKLLEENVHILHDQVVSIEKDGQSLQLAGLDDPDFTDRDSAVQSSILQTKLQEMDLSGEYCVLLSHRPEAFEAYAAEGIDLALCGHAHGGQFRLPFIGGLIAPNQGFFPEYDAGLYTRDDTNMIVSRGIGNSIIPIRFNNRPEIVIIQQKCDGQGHNSKGE